MEKELTKAINELRKKHPGWPQQKYEWIAKHALGVLR